MEKSRYQVPETIRQRYPDFIFSRQQDYRGESETITIMHHQGHAIAIVYWFYDTPNRVFLENLVVDEDHRKKGLALQLQLLREDIGRDRGAKWALLWVVKRSWMIKWYKRRGYRWHCTYDDDPKCMWMKKKAVKPKVLQEALPSFFQGGVPKGRGGFFILGKAPESPAVTLPARQHAGSDFFCSSRARPRELPLSKKK